jgi:putative transposase
MPKKYLVKLTASARQRLEALVEQKRGSARQQRRMQALLLSADGSSDEDIAEEVGLHVSSLERLRKRCAKEGWEVAIRERRRSGAPVLLDAKQEAVLVSLACEKPSNGQARWSLRQLGERLIALEVVETISHETIRRTLKKTSLSRGKSGPGACRT